MTYEKGTHTMAIENPAQNLTPVQRQALRETSTSIGDIAATRRELGEIADQLEALTKQRTAAQRQYETDSHIAGGRFVTDEMREAARRSAEDPLAETEARIRRETMLLNRRAQSIVAQLNQVAETPSLSNLPAETLGKAAQMIPILQVQLSGLTLPQLTQRLRAAQVRGDEGELFAYTTVAGAHLAERQTAPKPNDSDRDFYAARDIVSQLQAGFRDDALDPVIAQAGAVVDEVSTFDRQVITDKSERGETDPYNFLGEGAA
jgi:hypothetical protein